MAATRKKQDPAALDSISVAFVTFEHEESKKRCLEDFRYSRRGFCRSAAHSLILGLLPAASLPAFICTTDRAYLCQNIYPCQSLSLLFRRFQPAKLQFARMPAEEHQDAQDQASGRKKKPRVQKWRLKVFQVIN